MDVNVLVACFGNVLRGDDGFGGTVADRLLAQAIPDGVRVMEVGIGGIHLVQELLRPVDALVIVDAVDLGRHPGTVLVIRPEVPVAEGPDAFADMHYATPERTLMLAASLGILPDTTLLVGCQPLDAERYGQGLSPEVDAAIDAALAQVRQTVSELGIPWY